MGWRYVTSGMSSEQWLYFPSVFLSEVIWAASSAFKSSAATVYTIGSRKHPRKFGPHTTKSLCLLARNIYSSLAFNLGGRGDEEIHIRNWQEITDCKPMPICLSINNCRVAIIARAHVIKYVYVIVLNVLIRYAYAILSYRTSTKYVSQRIILLLCLWSYKL